MFNLDDYDPVEKRLGAPKEATTFWQDYPDGRIDTQDKSPVNDSKTHKFVCYLYKTYMDPVPFASGWAKETESDRGVNSTSALENCETSAIGRALANAGYAAKGKRPSREEMTKVAGAKKVESEIADVKAKMAQTSKEYIPVPVADDVWTVHPTEAPKTIDAAVDLVKSIIGGQTEKDIPHCAHGEMEWRTGTTKAGKPWGHFRCKHKWQPDGTGGCQDGGVLWYEIKPDGSWGKQQAKF